MFQEQGSGRGSGGGRVEGGGGPGGRGEWERRGLDAEWERLTWAGRRWFELWLRWMVFRQWLQLVDRRGVSVTISVMAANGNGSPPALTAQQRSRVDAMVAYLMSHRARLEQSPKLTVIFHCGPRDVSIELVEKEQVAVIAT